MVDRTGERRVAAHVQDLTANLDGRRLGEPTQHDGQCRCGLQVDFTFDNPVSGPPIALEISSIHDDEMMGTRARLYSTERELQRVADEKGLGPPARHPDEKGGAPDYAVLWRDRLWVIELRTEKGSHRPAQIPMYFELARHHHPEAAIDLLYVTPPMTTPAVTKEPWGRFAHMTWGDVADLVRDAWPSPSSQTQQEVIDGLLNAIASLHLKPREWRAMLPVTASSEVSSAPEAPAPAPPEPVSGAVLELAMEAVQLTADDGRQRAVDVVPNDLEDLLELRLLTRDALGASRGGSRLRHVVPWIWQDRSGGAALTAAGQDLGIELRLSRYRTPQY